MATNPCEYDCGRIDALEFEPRVGHSSLPSAEFDLPTPVKQAVDTAIDKLAFEMMQAEGQFADASLAMAKKYQNLLDQMDKVGISLHPTPPLPTPDSIATKLPIKTVEEDSIGKYESSFTTPPAAIPKTLEKYSYGKAATYEDYVSGSVGMPASFTAWLNSLGSSSEMVAPVETDEATSSDTLGTPSPVTLEIPLG